VRFARLLGAMPQPKPLENFRQMKNGDIVSLRDRPGLWVYAGSRPGEIPPLTQAKFINTLNHAITCGIAMATPISSPVFSPGDVVKFHDGTAIVESDGADSVVLTYNRHVAVPPRGFYGEYFEHECRATAPRAELVRSNISKFTGEAQ
jgi:hypothetical protein